MKFITLFITCGYVSAAENTVVRVYERQPCRECKGSLASSGECNIKIEGQEVLQSKKPSYASIEECCTKAANDILKKEDCIRNAQVWDLGKIEITKNSERLLDDATIKRVQETTGECSHIMSKTKPQTHLQCVQKCVDQVIKTGSTPATVAKKTVDEIIKNLEGEGCVNEKHFYDYEEAGKIYEKVDTTGGCANTHTYGTERSDPQPNDDWDKFFIAYGGENVEANICRLICGILNVQHDENSKEKCVYSHVVEKHCHLKSKAIVVNALKGSCIEGVHNIEDKEICKGKAKTKGCLQYTGEGVAFGTTCGADLDEFYCDQA